VSENGNGHITVSAGTHPHGIRVIRHGKSVGGIGGFALAAAASALHDAVLYDVILRGLVGGTIGYLLGWAAAVHIARHVVKAHVQTSAEQVYERARALREKAAES